MSHAKPASLLSSLIEIGQAQLRARIKGLGDDGARSVMEGIAAELQARHGGSELYLPSLRRLLLVQRNAAIVRACCSPGPDGTQPSTAARLAQVAHSYGISVRQVRQILAAARRGALS